MVRVEDADYQLQKKLFFRHKLLRIGQKTQCLVHSLIECFGKADVVFEVQKKFWKAMKISTHFKQRQCSFWSTPQKSLNVEGVLQFWKKVQFIPSYYFKCLSGEGFKWGIQKWRFLEEWADIVYGWSLNRLAFIHIQFTICIKITSFS